MRERAIVLLSGGADSVTCLALAARRDGRECLALSFAYGQVHRAELEAAATAARTFAASHRVVTLEPGLFAASALTGGDAIPLDRDEESMAGSIPATYVPARNLVFLSMAVALAESNRAGAVYIGVNALDYSGYPDCRPRFIQAFHQAATLGTRAGDEGCPVEIVTPLIAMSKAEIFRTGTDLGVDFGATVSCYAADEAGRACGRCDSCRLRAKGFREAGLADPTRYRE